MYFRCCFGNNGTIAFEMTYRAVHIGGEVTARIAKAGVAFGRLCGNVCGRSGSRLVTKLRVYTAVVLLTLLYECETCTV